MDLETYLLGVDPGFSFQVFALKMFAVGAVFGFGLRGLVSAVMTHQKENVSSD